MSEREWTVFDFDCPYCGAWSRHKCMTRKGWDAPFHAARYEHMRQKLNAIAAGVPETDTGGEK